MTFFHSLKQKSVLIVIAIITFSIFITYIILSNLYFTYHENRIINAISVLMKEVEQDLEIVDEASEWLDRNVTLNLYLFNDVNEALMNIPFDTNGQEVLSMSDHNKLANGEMVINKMKITHLEFSVLTFFYPIVENDEMKCLLFSYYPIEDFPAEGIITLFLSLSFTFAAAIITFLLAKRSFGKSYRQLQEIKQSAIKVSKGNYDAKIWNNSKDEVGEVSEVFNMMALSLKDERERVKEFMEDISHEIKTPLTYIKAYNQALLDDVIQKREEQVKTYELIARETGRLQKLIQNFLDFAKLDAQAIELNKQPVVFAQSIEDIMRKYEPIFSEKNVAFNMMLDYEVIIDADEERIEQIIQNVVQNAILYSDKHPRININLSKQDTTCILIIKDNGIGISEKDLAIIKNRFVRVNKVKSQKESGAGIGLSIVEKLMTLHDGHLHIESQLTVGTTVVLTFPLYEK